MNCQKKFLLSIIFCLVFVGYTEAARIYEKEGAFSWIPPAGWVITDGIKFRRAVGPEEDGFPNINVSFEHNGLRFIDYVESNIEFMKKEFDGFKILSRHEYSTENGVKGNKIITVITSIDAELKPLPLMQILYFFAIKQNKYGIVCTSPTNNALKFEKLFDQCIRTFVFQ